jgi:hypothetical protein
MELFTPRGKHFQGIYRPKRWALVDSNIPKNVRAALLKPPQSLPSPLNSARSASSRLEPTLSPLAMRVMEATRNHTRVDLLQAIESADADADRPGDAPLPAAASSALLAAVERGLNLLGIALHGGALRALAQELTSSATVGSKSARAPSAGPAQRHLQDLRCRQPADSGGISRRTGATSRAAPSPWAATRA